MFSRRSLDRRAPSGRAARGCRCGTRRRSRGAPYQRSDDRHSRVARGRHRRLEALNEHAPELGIAIGQQRLHRRDVRRRPQNPRGEIRRAAEAFGLLAHDDRRSARRRGRPRGQPRLSPTHDHQVDHPALLRNVTAVASLSDISRHAGVSIATCSRVLNGSAHPVSEATRKRVLNAAEELGYAPSALARALVTRSEPDHRRDRRRHRRPLLRRDRARRRGRSARDLGYLTMVCSAERRHRGRARPPAPAARLPRRGDRLRRQRPRARPGARDARRRPSPTRRERGSVVVALAQRDFDAPSIVFDNEAAAYDITAYVRALGHRADHVRRGPAGPAHERAAPAAASSAPGGTRPRRPAASPTRTGSRPPSALLARDTLPDAVVGRQRRGRDRRADAAARRRRRRARPGLDRRHRRHAPGALRRADDGHRAAARDGPRAAHACSAATTARTSCCRTASRPRGTTGAAA